MDLKNFTSQKELNSSYQETLTIPVSGYVLRLAAIEDGDRIWTIMDEVYEMQENKSLFCCDEHSSVMDILKHYGFGIVACDENGSIAASLLVKFPQLEDDNLGYDIGLPKEALTKVAHIESVVVLPGHRGKNLQNCMIAYAEKLIDTDFYTYLMATVSPDNAPSLHTFKKNGYEVVKIKEKYGGLMRCILLKRTS